MNNKKVLRIEFNLNVMEERIVYEKIVEGIKMYGNKKRYVMEAVKKNEFSMDCLDSNLSKLLKVLTEQNVKNPESVPDISLKPVEEVNVPEESNEEELIRLLEENNFLDL